MAVDERQIRRALTNVSSYGDTDIFPFPFENHIFHDLPDDSATLLLSLDSSFDQFLRDDPPFFDNQLATVGYHGFRWATQQDPFWNAYLLALVLEVAPDLERARLPIAANRVFSYRLNPDTTQASLFSDSPGYRQYIEHSRMVSSSHQYVVCCDISDFYPRIYHHRLENALFSATKNTEVIRRIMRILSAWSQGRSYGLPVGGPAARILSEVLLNRVDRLLQAERIEFCRYVDDYRLFASSREDAYTQLIFLSSKLLENEGLQLQKQKTRIMSTKEYAATLEDDPDDARPAHTKSSLAEFMQLRVHYDPYSATAEDDYAALKTELRRFDIPNLLAHELRKTRIQQPAAKKLIHAVKYLPDEVAAQAVRSLIDSLDVLYPVFPTAMLVLKDVIPRMSDTQRSDVLQVVRNTVANQSYLTRVPVNLGFALRCIIDDPSEEATAVLAAAYKSHLVPFIRRDCILGLAKRGADYWISDRRVQFQMLSEWEKRALIVASFVLGDEGSHWRRGITPQLSPMAKLVSKWASGRGQGAAPIMPI